LGNAAVWSRRNAIKAYNSLERHNLASRNSINDFYSGGGFPDKKRVDIVLQWQLQLMEKGEGDAESHLRLLVSYAFCLVDVAREGYFSLLRKYSQEVPLYLYCTALSPELGSISQEDIAKAQEISNALRVHSGFHEEFEKHMLKAVEYLKGIKDIMNIPTKQQVAYYIKSLQYLWSVSKMFEIQSLTSEQCWKTIKEKTESCSSVFGKQASHELAAFVVEKLAQAFKNEPKSLFDAPRKAINTYYMYDYNYYNEPSLSNDVTYFRRRLAKIRLIDDVFEKHNCQELLRDLHQDRDRGDMDFCHKRFFSNIGKDSLSPFIDAEMSVTRVIIETWCQKYARENNIYGISSPTYSIGNMIAYQGVATDSKEAVLACLSLFETVMQVSPNEEITKTIHKLIHKKLYDILSRKPESVCDGPVAAKLEQLRKTAYFDYEAVMDKVNKTMKEAVKQGRLRREAVHLHYPRATIIMKGNMKLGEKRDIKSNKTSIFATSKPVAPKISPEEDANERNKDETENK
jgi:hypothetical protein